MFSFIQYRASSIQHFFALRPEHYAGGANRPADGNRLPAETAADGVDGADEALALFRELPVAVEEGDLGRREHQPVADQPQVPDSHPPRPGSNQGLAGGREQAPVAGTRRPDRGRTGATHAVGVVQHDGYALRRPPAIRLGGDCHRSGG
jgi:hypothetical protein